LTDITVAQAAIIEDHVWALMEALGVRDSLAINRRISEAIGTVLDRQRDALPATEVQEDYEHCVSVAEVLELLCQATARLVDERRNQVGSNSWSEIERALTYGSAQDAEQRIAVLHEVAQ
jgi:hypothetical protein